MKVYVVTVRDSVYGVWLNPRSAALWLRHSLSGEFNLPATLDDYETNWDYKPSEWSKDDVKIQEMEIR